MFILIKLPDKISSILLRNSMICQGIRPVLSDYQTDYQTDYESDYRAYAVVIRCGFAWVHLRPESSSVVHVPFAPYAGNLPFPSARPIPSPSRETDGRVGD